MGIIWQDEILKNRRKAEWAAFLWGVAVTLMVITFVVLFVVRLSGGVEACK